MAECNTETFFEVILQLFGPKTYNSEPFVINVYGTSHVSEQSLELIDKKFQEHNPDIIAIELDLVRLNALVEGNQTRDGPFFIRLIKTFQNYIGSKTGVMPGDEMLYAYKKAINSGKDVYLIDQDIRITVNRLNEVPRKEKVKAFFESLLGFLIPGKISLTEIPEEELIEKLLKEMKRRYPRLYQVLVQERNDVMVEGIEHIQEENPEKDILVFVGAAHSKEIRNRIKEINK